MDEQKKYYLIKDRFLGKKEDDIFYLFKDGKWIIDEDFVILGYLIGFDESEPEGSPYGIGNTGIMDSIEKITEQEAMEFLNSINRQKEK